MSYTDLINKVVHNIKNKDSGYTMTLFPRFNACVGNIIESKYTVIGGSPGVGVSSFINQNYVLGPLLQYVNDESEDIQPIKILYFTTAMTAEKKFQQLLCLYLMLVEHIHIDIPTLLSKPGRMYDLESRADVVKAIEDSESFFENILDKSLYIVDNIKSPTNILTYTKDFIDNYHAINEENSCTFLVVVDSTSYLEEDRSSNISFGDKEIDKEMNKVALELIRDYKVHCVLNVPTKLGFVRSPKDTEPTHSHLGIFGSKCDYGIVIYDSIGERNTMTAPYEGVYVNTKGRNTLRYCYVVRNSEGNNLFKVPYLFLGGSGFSKEFKDLSDFSSFMEVKDSLIGVPGSPYCKLV